MLLKNLVALCAAFLLCVSTGCHLAGGGACGTGCDSGGCASGGCAGSCATGSCGGLLGLLPGGGGCLGGGCVGGGDISGCVTPAELTHDGYGSRGGYVGPLAGFIGEHHRGAQSHMGAYPGPADGPPSPTMTYPYYTSRGPRDFFANNPPSIGP